MSAAQYNILADQGSTLKFYAEYQTSGGTGIDLNGYRAEMQVRRNSSNSDMLLFLTGTTMSHAVTGGGSTGHFSGISPDIGVVGEGGITLNAGTTGQAIGTSGGVTGGIYIRIDPTTMANIPVGRHLYDLELINGTDVTRIIQGRFEVEPEVTR